MRVTRRKMPTVICILQKCTQSLSDSFIYLIKEVSKLSSPTARKDKR